MNYSTERPTRSLSWTIAIPSIALAIVLIPASVFAQNRDPVDCMQLAQDKLLPKLEQANAEAYRLHSAQIESFEEREDNALTKIRAKVARAERNVNRVCQSEPEPTETCAKAMGRVQKLIAQESRIASKVATQSEKAIARADAALRRSIDRNQKRYDKEFSKTVRKCEARQTS